MVTDCERIDEHNQIHNDCYAIIDTFNESKLQFHSTPVECFPKIPSNVCRLRIIKTRTERGRPGTEASHFPCVYVLSTCIIICVSANYTIIHVCM